MFHPDGYSLGGLSPEIIAADGGDVVTVDGGGFNEQLNTVRVDNASIQNWTTVSDNKATFIAPAHAAGTVNVELHFDDIRPVTKQITYVPAKYVNLYRQITKYNVANGTNF